MLIEQVGHVVMAVEGRLSASVVSRPGGPQVLNPHRLTVAVWMSGHQRYNMDHLASVLNALLSAVVPIVSYI